ncbi:MAG: hypothetical protein QM676_03755 [Novosphingobium sp.]
MPLIFPSVIGLTDLGGHLGRFAVQLDGGQSESLRQWYSFRWDLIPNLGTDLLMQLLAPILGLEPALKLIVIAIVGLQLTGFVLLARTAHGKVPVTALFALPLAYSFPFNFGFINFALSTALATFALALWIALGDAGQPAKRWLIFVPIACLLWICHLAGWALFCVFAGSDELIRQTKRGWRSLSLGVAIAALSCLLAPWLIKFSLQPAQAAIGEISGFFDFTMKFSFLLQVVRDRSMIWDIASAVLMLAAIGWFHSSTRFERHDGLALGVTIAFGLYLLVPHVLLGSYFADMRLVPMIMAISLIAVRPGENFPKHLANGLAIVGFVFVGLRFAGNGISLAIHDREFSQDLALLDAVPRGSQLVTLVERRCDTLGEWNSERRTHLAGYAIARRQAFGNDQWMIPGGQLLTVHNPAAGPFAKDPSQQVSDRSCEGWSSLEQAVSAMPASVPMMWVIGGEEPRSWPGWHEIRRSARAAVYSRDSIELQR